MTCKTVIVDIIVCKVIKLLNHVTHTYVNGIGETREI